MKKNSIVDYSGYFLLKYLGPLIRCLPVKAVYFLGRRLGEAIYLLDFKHRAIAYSNMKRVLGSAQPAWRLKKTLKGFYRSFGQSIMDLFLIPSINEKYINKYISIDGRQNLDEAFKKGKGVIFCGVHEGSWEIYNIVCANLGLPFVLFVRQQSLKRMDALLNSYRRHNQSKVIQREASMRQLVEVLESNESIGMTVDQGGAKGERVKFFGKNASMATGAIRLAIKRDVTLVPAFYHRLKGQYAKIIIDKPFKIEKTGNIEEDVRLNLERLIQIFEGYIKKYPTEFYWPYRIWKYSDERSVLVLSDGKAGHIRQSDALLKLIKEHYAQAGIKADVQYIDVKFKNKFSKFLLQLSACFSGRYSCQGCFWCLRRFIEPNVLGALTKANPDLVVSCGSSLAAINFLVSRESLAKSIVIMKPSVFSVRRFDLVIMPRHDAPPRRKNVVMIDGVLTGVNKDYLKEKMRLLDDSGLYRKGASFNNYIGLFIGGKSKKFGLSKDTALAVIRQLKDVCSSADFGLLATTSRRTTDEVARAVKDELHDEKCCSLLVIYNEKNYPFISGGILAKSDIVVVSADSISMVCEAIDSLKHVIVFKDAGLSGRHKALLNNFARKGLIHLIEPVRLKAEIEEIIIQKPVIKTSSKESLIREALKKVL
ncbi:MAG: hypothetical protein C4533_01540 [Candidatus Omnitrophota bacterium]|jgi:KDO2-lipid IV(A) lauroyltransferase|nr:MAG: hypothetical protein C4533_01540 [Candidatus Omnitrophota bacterium]